MPASPGWSQPRWPISASSANTPKMQLIASKATRAAQVRTPFGRLPREPKARAGEGESRQAGPHAGDRRDADRGKQAAAEQDRDERLPHVEPELERDHARRTRRRGWRWCPPRRRRSRAASCCARSRECARTRGVRGRRRRWTPRSGCSDDRSRRLARAPGRRSSRPPRRPEARRRRPPRSAGRSGRAARSRGATRRCTAASSSSMPASIGPGATLFTQIPRRSELARERLGQRDHAALRRRIGGIAR